MEVCKYKKFMCCSDLVDFVNSHGIKQADIVSIVYNPKTIEYVVIYFN